MSEYETYMSEYIRQIDNTLSVTDGRVNEIYVQIQEVKQNQNSIKDYLCIYTGCCNLILMIILLTKFLPARKGVLKK